jgi:hypothetical protein
MHNGLVISINQFLSCSWIKCHTICFFNNNIIVQVRYIIIETKEVARIGYNGFLFPHSYSGDGLGNNVITILNEKKINLINYTYKHRSCYCQ